jgi:hypothetical protein
MDWPTLFTTLLVIAFVVLMMRGCGGMSAGGGCGMQGHRPRKPRPESPESAPRGSESNQ